MDDSRVTQVGLPTVLRQNAYLLFYVKTVKPRPVPPLLLPSPAKPQASSPEAAAMAAASTPTKKHKAEEERALPRRPETPGWSDVLARLKEEDAKAEDHSKDLKSTGEALDTSWSQPEVGGVGGPFVVA